MHFTRFAALSFALAACLTAQQQTSPHATKVIASDTNGGAGGGIFNPLNALGKPDGAMGVHSLGNGGSLTLGFDLTIVDGPGADFIVSENAFASGSNAFLTFAELCFVEVSSNGVDFARFPARYAGGQAEPGPFAFVPAGRYMGLAGRLPVNTLAVDPQDVVQAGGDAFDLADLSNDPLVTSGKVDLDGITQIRLIDVVSGTSLDSRGVVIRDPGSGSADIDAVTVVQHSANQTTTGPLLELDIPADGNYRLKISDPGGIGDLDPNSWLISVLGVPISPLTLAGVSVITASTPTSITLRLGFSLPPGMPAQLSVSIRDRAGQLCGVARTRPL